VFFEVLLIASYGLLLHGGGAARTRATLQYVVLNLIGSSLFLMGAAMIYAAAGSLNMAHLASELASLAPADAALAGAGGMLLVAVFALKAALLPLHAWMVPAYAAAAAPVAVLFAMLTKVGVYALLRLLILLAVVGPGQPILAPLGLILTLAAVLTIAAGSLGVMASASLRPMIAYLVMVSIGTLLAGIAPGTSDGLAAALYYLIHTTLITGGLFLLADLVVAGRAQGGRLVIGDRPPSAAVLAPLFLLGALAIAGLPPLSGFLGKVLILDAVKDAAPLNDSAAWPWVWGAVLGSSMLVLLGLSRAGVLLLWRGRGSERTRPTVVTQSSSAVGSAGGLERGALVATIGLLSASPLLMLFAGPLTAFTLATARQTLDNSDYVAAVATLVPTSQAVSARTEGLQP
jgi:multicomponent K+:H+ antiporter subunit D